MLIDIMSNSLLNVIGVDPFYYIAGLAGIVVILFILLCVQLAKQSKLRKRLDAFMSGNETKSLEDEISAIEEFMKLPYSKIGIVKYDAFKEMGGNMSFALCMLNEKNDGMLMNSMHSREGCYTYIKEIINGESYIELSEEEKEALDNAVQMRNEIGDGMK